MLNNILLGNDRTVCFQEGLLRQPIQKSSEGWMKKQKQALDQNFAVNIFYQERKSVKIGGVTKAPEESGGNSLQFLQVQSSKKSLT